MLKMGKSFILLLGLIVLISGCVQSPTGRAVEAQNTTQIATPAVTTTSTPMTIPTSTPTPKPTTALAPTSIPTTIGTSQLIVSLLN